MIHWFFFWGCFCLSMCHPWPYRETHLVHGKCSIGIKLWQCQYLLLKWKSYGIALRCLLLLRLFLPSIVCLTVWQWSSKEIKPWPYNTHILASVNAETRGVIFWRLPFRPHLSLLVIGAEFDFFLSVSWDALACGFYHNPLERCIFQWY